MHSGNFELSKSHKSFLCFLLTYNLVYIGANYRIIPRKVESLQIHTPNYIFISLHQNKGYESINLNLVGYENVKPALGMADSSGGGFLQGGSRGYSEGGKKQLSHIISRLILQFSLRCWRGFF